MHFAAKFLLAVVALLLGLAGLLVVVAMFFSSNQDERFFTVDDKSYRCMVNALQSTCLMSCEDAWGNWDKGFRKPLVAATSAHGVGLNESPKQVPGQEDRRVIEATIYFDGNATQGEIEPALRGAVRLIQDNNLCGAQIM